MVLIILNVVLNIIFWSIFLNTKLFYCFALPNIICDIIFALILFLIRKKINQKIIRAFSIILPIWNIITFFIVLGILLYNVA